ncbi:MAG TPA: NAD-dependent epimerase/dehydratase family protein [Solirubrobacteraceae bacterium]|nr:NAD-dependent epimerase/dehydratase family protein [Solirubrobacteraceae bacterium]
MRALVTGGAGFIGSHIVRRLLATGHDVRVVDNLSTGRLSNLDEVIGDIEFFELDIRDAEALRAPAIGCEAIIHLAALPSVPRSIADPAASHEANATGTLNVLNAAREGGVTRVVAASSSSIYGAARELPKREEMRPLPISPYAVSKLAGESYCRSFFEVYGLEAVALRYFNVFGPRQDPNSEYAAVIPKFIRAFRLGESPVINGDGEQSRDFTYVENVVNANMAAIGVPGIGGRVYNIACGTGVTLNEIAARLREEIGADVEPVHGPERLGDVRDSLADISAARTDLGYEPAVGLENGIRRTVSYYRGLELGSKPATRQTKRLTLVHTPQGKPAPMAGKRYLITGGAGFIGSHLTEALIDRDESAKVVILDDLSTGSFENIEHMVDGDRVTFVRGSVTDAATVDSLMRDADQCVHLASAVGVQMIVNEPLDTLMKSVRGSNVVMHAATRNDVRVLFSSTSEVYGKQSHQLLSEDDDLVFGSPSKGRWTYAIAKSFGEALIHGYHRQRGVDATIVRLFNCVGPRQSGTYGMVLPRFVRQALANEDLTVYGDGKQTRCFTHVRDTVAALVALSDSDRASGGTYNIGTSKLISIHELARRVIVRSGSDSGVVLVPYEQAYASGFEELGTRVPDTDALEDLTGWRAELTINDAIDDVIAFERAQLDDTSSSVGPAAAAGA